ncbi:MAG: M48 family metalloprotease [Cyanobacteria bacterium J06560_2]
MKKATIQRLFALMAAAAIAVATFIPGVQAKAPDPFLAFTPNKQADAFFQRARADMEGSLGRVGEDYYAVYRMVERISRANGLDEQPWRVRVTTDDVLNAYASELNMLTFEGGILEQLSGDTAAISCVVGHEMAHHTQGHLPKRVEAQAEIAALQEQALIDARAEVESANRQGNIFNAVIGAVTGAVGGSTRSTGGRIATATGGRVLEGLNEAQTNDAIARAEELYEERIAELDAEYLELSRDNETEADNVGYEYVVRAGFDPSGCARAMGVLTRTETSRLPGLTHPKPEDRVVALTALNTPAVNQPLISSGEANLSRSPNPLEYNLSRDNSAIRIESRYGSQDIDDGFPQ